MIHSEALLFVLRPKASKWWKEETVDLHFKQQRLFFLNYRDGLTVPRGHDTSLTLEQNSIVHGAWDGLNKIEVALFAIPDTRETLITVVKSKFPKLSYSNVTEFVDNLYEHSFASVMTGRLKKWTAKDFRNMRNAPVHAGAKWYSVKKMTFVNRNQEGKITWERNLSGKELLDYARMSYVIFFSVFPKLELKRHQIQLTDTENKLLTDDGCLSENSTIVKNILAKAMR